MKNLIVMVGLPRSGKSTWAKSHGAPMVNPDSIRIALHGNRFIASAEPMVWAIAKYMVESLFEAGHETVILDATNTTEARRSAWKSDKWECSFKVINTSRDECVQRAFAENDKDIIPIINSMAEKFEPVSGHNVFA